MTPQMPQKRSNFDSHSAAGVFRPVPATRDNQQNRANSLTCVTLAGRRLSRAAVMLRLDGRSINELTAWLGAGAGRSSVARWLSGEATPNADSTALARDRLGIGVHHWHDFAYLPLSEYSRGWRTNHCELSAWRDSVHWHSGGRAVREPSDSEERLWSTVHAELLRLPERVSVEWRFAKPTSIYRKPLAELAHLSDVYPLEATSAREGLGAICTLVIAVESDWPAFLARFADVLSRHNVPELHGFAVDFVELGRKLSEAELLALGDGVQ
jgi:hypothetical protein